MVLCRFSCFGWLPPTENKTNAVRFVCWGSPKVEIQTPDARPRAGPSHIVMSGRGTFRAAHAMPAGPTQRPARDALSMECAAELVTCRCGRRTKPLMSGALPWYRTAGRRLLLNATLLPVRRRPTSRCRRRWAGTRGLCVRTQPSQLRGSTHPRAGSFRSSARPTRPPTRPTCLMSTAWATTSTEFPTMPARSRLPGRCSCSTSPPNSSTTLLCLRSVPPRSGHAGVRVRDGTGVGMQLLFNLGMPVEGHVEEINDYRCPVSTARHFYLARQCHFAAPFAPGTAPDPDARSAGRGSS